MNSTGQEMWNFENKKWPKSRESKLWREIVSCSQIWVRFLEGMVTNYCSSPGCNQYDESGNICIDVYSISIYQQTCVPESVLSMRETVRHKVQFMSLRSFQGEENKTCERGMKKILPWAMRITEGTSASHLDVCPVGRRKLGWGFTSQLCNTTTYLPTLCSFSSLLNEIKRI